MNGPAVSTPRGVLLRGRVWPGGHPGYADGVVVLDADGRVSAMGPADAIDVPDAVPTIGGDACWVGPGIIDAHVHLAFGSPAAVVAGSVTSVRDLGAPLALAAQWRTTTQPARSPHVSVAGPILTAPGGYPSQGWGRDGFAMFVADPAGAGVAVRSLAGSVDVIKIALEPAGGPLPSKATVQAVVAAAHDVGLAVIAHALTVDTVRTALRAGVDELAHIPLEVLPADVIEQIAAADMLVVSTIQTMVAGDRRAGANVQANAAALCAAGVRLCYGSDLGNAGTSPGVDPRELRELAAAGLGAAGALHAATVASASAHGITGGRGVLVLDELADVVVLTGDPLQEPELWQSPAAVFVAGRRT